MDCIFCRICSGAIKADILLENDWGVVILDRAPVAPVHALVIAKNHIESAFNLSEDERAGVLPGMFTLIKRFAGDRGLLASGFRVVTNVGEHAGQTVKHLHFHVVGGAPLGAFGAMEGSPSPGA